MIETLAMIVAGYAGYAEWPWWTAAFIGAGAGVWNASNRFNQVWSERLEGSQRTKALLSGCLFTGTISAMVFSGIYFLVHWVTA